MEIYTYQGNCHCAAIKYIVKLPELKSVATCNCSICHKKGYKFAYLEPDCLTFERGKDELVEYRFANKNVAHKFCPNCGTAVMEVFNNGTGIGINVRTFMNVDLESLEIKKANLDCLPPLYVPPEFSGKLPDVQGDSLKTYTGSCHCGSVQVALKSKPLPERIIKEDTCSICVRNAYVFVYPSRSQVSIVGAENTTGYQFGIRFSRHHFCKTCGVPVYMDILGPPNEVLETWPEARKELVKKKVDLCPINLRILHDVDWNDLKIERDTTGADGYTVD